MISKLKGFFAPILIASFCSQILPTQALVPYHWLIKIEARNYPKRLNYAQSKLAPLVKCDVSYKENESPDEAIPYETFWCCNRKAFGLERPGELRISPGSAIAIKIVDKSVSPTLDVYRAAANVAIRLFLDVRIHKCMLAQIEVPDAAWDAMTDSFASQHYFPVDQASDTSFEAVGALWLRDESGTRSLLLSYDPNR